jgi:hypothetical protein
MRQGPCGTRTVLDADLPAGDYVLVVEGFSRSEGDFDIAMTCRDESQGFLDGDISCGARINGSTVGAGSHGGNAGR